MANHRAGPTGPHNPENKGQVQARLAPTAAHTVAVLGSGAPPRANSTHRPIVYGHTTGQQSDSASSEDHVDPQNSENDDQNLAEEVMDGAFDLPDDPVDKPVALPVPESIEREPTTTIREQFIRYLARADKDFVQFEPEYEAALSQ